MVAAVSLEHRAFQIYDLLWKIALPFLKLNRRLADGFDQRRFACSLPEPADIWIQAASVGEAFLAKELLKKLRPDRPVSVLVTTNTLQGKAILDRFASAPSSRPLTIRIQSAYFPFDQPTIMRRAVKRIRPAVMVLLETEMWPAHLRSLKNKGTPVVIANGRLSAKSLKRYRIWPSLWKRMAPNRILAMSEDDAGRFARLFGRERIEVIPNLKFDRFEFRPPNAGTPNPLEPLFAPEAMILVFGSIRREEEENVSRIVDHVGKAHPETVMCLFPRHAQRLDAWSAILDRQRRSWTLRSRIVKPVTPGSVILWDTYGELTQAYALCQAAFIGGSLAPLGGQNFLEAMASGVVPVIGPHWENFSWVGKEVVSRGLLRIAPDWRHAADLLTTALETSPEKDHIRQEACRFIKERQGGAARACRLIETYLSHSLSYRRPPQGNTALPMKRPGEHHR